jgi:hypothetical protein
MVDFLTVLLGGVAILTGGVVLLTNPRGVGARAMAHVSRNALPSQQRDMEQRPRTYRVAFGVGLIVIGGGWIFAALHG